MFLRFFASCPTQQWISWRFFASAFVRRRWPLAGAACFPCLAVARYWRSFRKDEQEFHGQNDSLNRAVLFIRFVFHPFTISSVNLRDFFSSTQFFSARWWKKCKLRKHTKNVSPVTVCDFLAVSAEKGKMENHKDPFAQRSATCFVVSMASKCVGNLH